MELNVARFGLRGTALARQADAHQAFAAGEDDAAVHVVPGVALVLRHDSVAYR